MKNRHLKDERCRKTAEPGTKQPEIGTKSGLQVSCCLKFHMLRNVWSKSDGMCVFKKVKYDMLGN